MIKTDHHPLTYITTKSKPSVRLGRWLSELADYQFKIEHKKAADKILADALSRLNLPNCDEEDMTRLEKIINSVGLQFEPEMEILEFHEMMEAMETAVEEEEPEPVELNSFEFFVQALSFFEGEAQGKLSSTEQSPANPVGSSNSRIEINSIKTAIMQENNQRWSQLLDKSTSTREGSPDPSLGEMVDDDSLTTMMVNSIVVDQGIVGRVPNVRPKS